MRLFLSALALTAASSLVSVATYAADTPAATPAAPPAAAPAAPPAAAPAAAGAEGLLRRYACAACHSTATKLVGPAYKDVAAKYRDDKGAEDKLAAKVKAGGAGVWGQVPMPPNASVKDEDVKTLVKWVLSLK